MGKRKDGQVRGQYTLEYELEAVRLVKGGQVVPVTAKILGVPTQTLGNWVRLSDKGQLAGAGDKPVSQEQMELARLRAQLARVTMERDILKKATAYFARESLCKYAWIARHNAHWPITLTCEVLGVSPNVERIGGARHTSRQGASQKAHAASWHQGQRQEEICCDHRQQAQPSHCR